MIPVFLEWHEHHEPSLKTFLKTEKRHDFFAAHSLAEFYAAVTRLPGSQRTKGADVILFLQQIRERLTAVALTADEYSACVEEAASAGVMGATIYDALIARCALKAGATTIYTWNIRHFQQLGHDIAKRVKAPSAS